jgi:hypothetical protein
MFKTFACLMLALFSLVACSRDQGWIAVPTSADADTTYKIQQGPVLYVQNSKGERTIVVVIQRYWKMSKATDLFKLRVAYADCQAGHGEVHTSDMYGHLNAVAAFARGVDTDIGALARAACAAAGVHE